MGVGQYIALRRIDDDARAGRLRLPLDIAALALRDVEEAAEDRILQQRVLLARAALGGDVDDAGGDCVEHRCEARQRRAAEFGYCPGRESRRRRADDTADQHQRRDQPLHSSWSCRDRATTVKTPRRPDNFPCNYVNRRAKGSRRLIKRMRMELNLLASLRLRIFCASENHVCPAGRPSRKRRLNAAAGDAGTAGIQSQSIWPTARVAALLLFALALLL